MRKSIFRHVLFLFLAVIFSLRAGYSVTYIQWQSQSPAGTNVSYGADVVITAKADTTFGENAYIKFTIDNWATWRFAGEPGYCPSCTYPCMKCDWQGSYGLFTGVIPSSNLAQGASVQYGLVVYSGCPPDPPQIGSQLAYDFNGGANFRFRVSSAPSGAVDVNLTQPNGGEVISGNYEIKWSATESQGHTSEIKNVIYWSTNNGSSWNLITTNLGNSGSYSWSTASAPNSSRYKIRIRSQYNAEIDEDVSDNAFTINNVTGTPYLILSHINDSPALYPCTNNIMVGSNFSITFSLASNNISDLFGVDLDIELSLNNLQFLSAQAGDLFSLAGKPYKFLSKSYSQSERIVVNIGETLKASNNNFPDKISGTGSIARIFFKAISPGNCLIDFKTRELYRSALGIPWITHNVNPDPQLVVDVQGNSPPVIHILKPVSGDIFYLSGDVLWTGSDPEGHNYRIDMDLGQEISGVMSWNTLVLNRSNYPEKYTVNTTSYPNGSKYRIRIIARDQFGAASTNLSDYFSINNDTSIPAIISTYPRILKGNIMHVDLGYSFHTNNGIRFVFNKSMNTTNVENNFYLLRAYQRITSGSFQWNSTGTELLFRLSQTNLPGNSLFEFYLDTANSKIKDSTSFALSGNYPGTVNNPVWFKTVIVTNEGGIVQSEDGKFTVTVPVHSLVKNSYVKMEVLNKKGILPSDKIMLKDSLYYLQMITDTDQDGEFTENDGALLSPGQTFQRNVTLKFYMQDLDHDGVIDNEDIDRSTVRFYRLNESTDAWEVIQEGANGISEDCAVCEVNRFSYVCCLGSRVNYTRDSVIVFPNPLDLNRSSSVKFRNLPVGALIEIYDITGNRIKKITTSAGSTQVIWDLKDDEGLVLKTGVYLYTIDGKYSGKLGVINKK